MVAVAVKVIDTSPVVAESKAIAPAPSTLLPALTPAAEPEDVIVALASYNCPITVGQALVTTVNPLPDEALVSVNVSQLEPQSL